jgi:hypothetical protein
MEGHRADASPWHRQFRSSRPSTPEAGPSRGGSERGEPGKSKPERRGPARGGPSGSEPTRSGAVRGETGQGQAEGTSSAGADQPMRRIRTVTLGLPVRPQPSASSFCKLRHPSSPSPSDITTSRPHELPPTLTEPGTATHPTTTPSDHHQGSRLEYRPLDQRLLPASSPKTSISLAAALARPA